LSRAVHTLAYGDSTCRLLLLYMQFTRRARADQVSQRTNGPRSPNEPTAGTMDRGHAAADGVAVLALNLFRTQNITLLSLKDGFLESVSVKSF
jgi:hypothetical protein